MIHTSWYVKDHYFFQDTYIFYSLFYNFNARLTYLFPLVKEEVPTKKFHVCLIAWPMEGIN